MPSRRQSPPLDHDSLEQLAIAYVGRYATTRVRLIRYLERKLWQRGWRGQGEPEPAALAERLADLGYLDDREFALARARSLIRRGYGKHRVRRALHAAGVPEEQAREARRLAGEAAWESALAFARKRRFGPFAESVRDRAAMRRAVAAMVRAGHDYPLARRIVESRPGELPEPPR